jgi:hypothetical protein
MVRPYEPQSPGLWLLVDVNQWTCCTVNPSRAWHWVVPLQRTGGDSPVQVEGSDLRVVPLIVREIKKVRGCLLLSCLPRGKGENTREGLSLGRALFEGERLLCAGCSSGWLLELTLILRILLTSCHSHH